MVCTCSWLKHGQNELQLPEQVTFKQRYKLHVGLQLGLQYFLRRPFLFRRKQLLRPGLHHNSYAELKQKVQLSFGNIVHVINMLKTTNCNKQIKNKQVEQVATPSEKYSVLNLCIKD